MGENNSNNVENVKVFIRIRPFIKSEKNDESTNIIQLRNNVISLAKHGYEKSFKFTKVFDQESTQIDLYKYVAMPIVNKVFNGYNGTIFAYGQSGSGKTYTMVGNIRKVEFKGILPNIFTQIFTEISLSNSNLSYVVTVTYLEIYNEEIRDLLSENPTKKLIVHEKPNLGVYIKDLLGFTVNSLEEITELLHKGNKNRVTGITKLNDTSSRSHAIFTITIESRNINDNQTTFGKLNLVDLAGSERVSKTFARGDRLKEAGKINLSLSVLGSVISALVDGKTSYIPYRNSKLTRLLQDSLGGNSLTSMISTISPKEMDYEESLYTLMYADRVRHIQNCVKINTEKKSVIESFQQKIEELRNKLQLLILKEQNENKLTKRKSKTSICDEKLQNIEEEKNILQNRIQMIQRKILVGGENLFEKVQEQLVLIEDTAKELEHLDSSHQLLEEILHYKGQEKYIVEKNYTTLQEEDMELDRRIEQLEKLIPRAKNILAKKEIEYQHEISTLLHTNKSLAKEMGIAKYIINNYVPKEYLNKIMNNLTWIDETQEWHLKGVASCGNNLRQNQLKSLIKNRSDSNHSFLAYSKPK